MAISRQRTKLLRDIDEFRANRFRDKLNLDRPGGSMPAAWFMGPKAENGELLREMVNQALDEAIEARKTYQPDDPHIPSIEDLEKEDYKVGADLFRQRFKEVLDYLRGSVPMASYRNQSHMYWDTTLPSIAGYFATMLYNQNNCTPEASPITTALEMEVGDDLCRMLGYTIPDREAVRHGAIRPWGHITCDGSVANIESMWAARNIKYLPVALAAALREDPDMASGRGLNVRTLQNKRRHLVDLDAWSLLNLPIDEVIKLPRRLRKAAGFSEEQVKAAMARYSIQDLGLVEFHRRFLPDTPPPVVMAPATAHYSWHKAGSLLGIGRSCVIGVKVDLDARTSAVELRRLLGECLNEGRPVAQVVAVLGSTEESAVDPLHDMVKIRNEFRDLGMEFTLHADGAWGGYFASMLRETAWDRRAAEPMTETERKAFNAERKKLVGEIEPNALPPDDPWADFEQRIAEATSEEERENIERAYVRAYGIEDPDGVPRVGLSKDFYRRSRKFAPGIGPSRYVKRQYECLKHCDTITVDPHKGGFVVYPAGALCYRNGDLRNIIAFASPVVAHGDIDQSVGFYGIEGSKPGAAATAVYLSHSLIPADRSGYGALLGKCMFASKRFYAGLVSMCAPEDPYYVTTFQRLPAEKVGASRAHVLDQIDLIRNQFVKNDGADDGRTDNELLEALSRSYELRELFLEMGSDQCIVAYTFNFRTKWGRNRSIDRLNEMNERMFEAMSLQKFNDVGVPDVDMLVTSSSFDPEGYGQDFVDTYARRIGVDPEPGKGIKFLISTQQNPWMTATLDGDFTPKIIEVLRGVAQEAAEYVITRHWTDHGEEHYGGRFTPERDMLGRD